MHRHLERTRNSGERTWAKLVNQSFSKLLLEGMRGPDGDNRFGRSCLVARRLVEAGVGCVTVPWMFKQSE